MTANYERLELLAEEQAPIKAYHEYRIIRAAYIIAAILLPIDIILFESKAFGATEFIYLYMPLTLMFIGTMILFGANIAWLLDTRPKLKIKLIAATKNATVRRIALLALIGIIVPLIIAATSYYWCAAFKECPSAIIIILLALAAESVICLVCGFMVLLHDILRDLSRR
jgi:hypothetical protein